MVTLFLRSQQDASVFCYVHNSAFQIAPALSLGVRKIRYNTMRKFHYELLDW